MKALILDLRNNPGGLLDGAVTIADMFLEKGRILTVKGRDGETVYEAKPENTFSGFPLAVLVNQHTASAAEIVAAALQDNKRAVILGERTFGQAIVRSIFKLKSGVGAVKIPVAVYYRPNGNSVNRFPDSKDTDIWGVTPDAGFEIPGTGRPLSEPAPDAGWTTGTAKPTAPPNDSGEDIIRKDRALQMAMEWIDVQLAGK